MLNYFLLKIFQILTAEMLFVMIFIFSFYL